MPTRRRPKLEPKKVVQMVDVRDLVPWGLNPRSITEERFESLTRALKADPQMMRARPTIALAAVDFTPDGTVIAGNMRLRSAQRLVEAKDADFLAEFPGGKVPTYIVTLDEPVARRWALRDNNPYGEWEDEALHEFLTDLAAMGGDIDLTGFPTASVQMILEGVAPKMSEPVQFRRLDDDLAAEFCCPGCGYEWSGNPRPGADPPVEEK